MIVIVLCVHKFIILPIITHEVVTENICALAFDKIGCIGCCKKAKFTGPHKSGLHANGLHKDIMIRYVSGLFILTVFVIDEL